jgi:hypothetical protein
MENKLRYLTEVEVSALTKIALPTLRNQRSRGVGIPYYKLKRSVRYLLSDVIDYMERHRIDTEEEWK